MKSKYYVTRSTEYLSNGCDCCDPIELDVYVVGEGRFAYLEEVYVHILEAEGIEVELADDV